MPCSVDPTASALLQRKLERILKLHPHADLDLAELYENISKSHRTACHARAIPGFNFTVWKYRCESRDMNRGQSSGFRVLAYFVEPERTMYPFYVYTKKDHEKDAGEQPPIRDIQKVVGRAN